MDPDPRHRELIALFTDLNEQAVLNEVRRLLDTEDSPLTILESCQNALRHVGEHYQDGRYYLSGLMMAGEIMRQVSEMLQSAFEKRIYGSASGRIVLGTVQGDIHDIGKNLIGAILRCHGFELIDLGVDVPPVKFLKATEEFAPNVIGMSGLLTVSYDAMRETVDLLRRNTEKGGHAVPIIIGGGSINSKVNKFVGSDYWAPDAMTGAKMCQRLLDSREAVFPQTLEALRL